MDWLRVLLMGASFVGVSEFFRRRLGFDEYISPLAAAGSVICGLMAGGMLGVLGYVWAALYAAGLASFGYYHVLKRRRPQVLLIVMIVLGVVYGFWRFSGLYPRGTDTVSHWALAVKYMLRENRFPDASTQLIAFQSYPLGTAGFMYYICRGTGLDSPGAYMCGQFLLNLIVFMPVFGFVEKRRVGSYICTAAMFVYLVIYNVGLSTLQVDTLKPMIAIGATAAIVRSRHDWKRLVGITLLSAVTLVYTKNSGAFFAVLIGVISAVMERAEGQKLSKKRLFGRILLYIGVTAAAFAVWTLHVKMVYSDGLSTKHAVSVSSYAQTAGEKDAGMMAQIAVDMVRHLLNPMKRYLLGGALAVMMLGFSGILAVRNLKRDAGSELRFLGGFVVKCALLYLVWYVMLYAMYLFSMPESEAVRLASLNRYEMTMQTYLLGLAFMVTMVFVNRHGFRLRADGFTACSAVAAVLFMVVFCVESKSLLARLDREEAYPEYFECVGILRDRYEIEDGKSVMALAMLQEDRQPSRAHYLIKYEFMTADIEFVMGGVEEDDGQPAGFYNYRYVPHKTTNEDAEHVPDVCGLLLERADSMDYILVLDQDPEIEAALARFAEVYKGDTPVMYAY